MNPSRERVVTILLLAGMTATFVAAVNLPGRRADAAMKQDIARAEAEVARGPLALARYKAEREELEGRRRYLAGSAAAVAPADPYELLGRISRLARESRIAVKRLEPEAVRPRESYTEHPFRLDFRGDLASLTAFLRGLEVDGRLFAVEDLMIRAPEDRASGGDLEGVLRFAAYTEQAGAAEFDEESGGAGGG